MLNSMDDNQIDSETEETVLHCAARSGSASFIEQVIRERPTNVRFMEMKIPPIGATPLRLAATAGSASAISTLLDYGAEVDNTDFKQQTPLFVAIKLNHLDCAEVLLRGGANPNGSDGNLSTPLYWAASSGFTAACKLLLWYGAGPTPIYPRYRDEPTAISCCEPILVRTPLHVSATYGHFDCFKTLLAAGSEPDLHQLVQPVSKTLIHVVSLAHTIVKYHYVEELIPHFALLGGCFWRKDGNGCLAIDFPMSSSSRSIMLLYMENPLKLQQICRIAIRRVLGPHRLSQVKTLQLPTAIEDFLLCKDIIPKHCLIYV